MFLFKFDNPVLSMARFGRRIKHWYQHLTAPSTRSGAHKEMNCWPVYIDLNCSAIFLRGILLSSNSVERKSSLHMLDCSSPVFSQSSWVVEELIMRLRKSGLSSASTRTKLTGHHLAWIALRCPLLYAAVNSYLWVSTLAKWCFKSAFFHRLAQQSSRSWPKE